MVVFYRGIWSDEDVDYFKDLAGKEDEINLAAASVVGIGVGGPDEARDFVKQSGIKSYVLYDYAKVASREWGTLEKDKEHGEHSRPAVFIVGSDHEVVHAWADDRPGADELLAKVGEITGLPKAVEEGEEEEKPKKPKKAAKQAETAEGETEKPKPDKPSPEEREKRRAAKAGREAGTEPEAGEPGTAKPAAKAGQTPVEKTPEQDARKPEAEKSEGGTEEKTAG